MADELTPEALAAIRTYAAHCARLLNHVAALEARLRDAEARGRAAGYHEALDEVDDVIDRRIRIPWSVRRLYRGLARDMVHVGTKVACLRLRYPRPEERKEETP